MQVEDTYRQKGLRRQLVELLRSKGIEDVLVLKAIEKIPRHLFFDKAFLEFAYQDKAFPIAAGQTISQPYTVAFQTQLLQPSKGLKVLEIGTGSGYQTAVLLDCGVRVWTIERQRQLYDTTKSLLPKMGYQPNFYYGDGYKGLPAFAPFDRILVTCGAPFIPPSLIEQLKPGGRLVIPVGEGSDQIMTLVTKSEQGELKQEEHGIFRFVPMLGEREWK